MDLSQIINKLAGDQSSRYGPIDVHYFNDGSFTLRSGKDGKKVEYNSQEIYSITTESPLLSWFSKRLGGPVEVERKAPTITIESIIPEERVKIWYDKEYDTSVIKIEKEGQQPLSISRMGYQFICSNSNINEHVLSKLVSSYEKLFKKEARLLDASTYGKKALEIPTHAYSM